MPQDYVQAMTWYRKAADAGDAKAMLNIGAMYAVGHGVPQDYADAVIDNTLSLLATVVATDDVLAVW